MSDWRSKKPPQGKSKGRFTKTPNKEKFSYGIACVRFNNSRPELLMVCKRFTYSFNIFVHGGYNPRSNGEIQELLNGMTVGEKLDIRSLNFVQLWYKIWLGYIPPNSNYYYCKNKFETTFARDGGTRLNKLLSGSKNSKLLWELPKGHKSIKNELDIHCAVREFQEETSIEKRYYKLFTDAIVYSYIDGKTKYTNKYYPAITRGGFTPVINFTNETQLEEINEIKWMGIEEIKHVDQYSRLTNLSKRIFAFAKKQKSLC